MKAERGWVYCSFHRIPDHHVANRSLHIGQVQFTPIKSSLYVCIRDLDLRLGEHLLAPGDFRRGAVHPEMPAPSSAPRKLPTYRHWSRQWRTIPSCWIFL